MGEKKKLLYEKMLRFEYLRFAIRCWVKTDQYGSGLVARPDLIKAINKWMKEQEPSLHPTEARCRPLAQALIEHFPNLNAVEVTLDGDGTVVYSDWP